MTDENATTTADSAARTDAAPSEESGAETRGNQPAAKSLAEASHPKDISLYTPVMRQFVEIKNRYPDTLVLFRMGDFYETFFEDAARANRLIGITLTKRGRLLDGTPIPMAGIPAVSLDQYIARLVRLGESVVIVEQIGTPGKGMMERRVSRIITPGTLTESALLPEKSDSMLLAIEPPKTKNGIYGFAWLTLSNGDFRAEEVAADQFDAELARIAPSEILVSEKFKLSLRSSHPELVVTSMPDWHFDADHGRRLLCQTFQLDNLDAWGISGKKEILAAANALLDYTSETQVDMIPFILPMKLVSESEFIVIDAASRRNLEIDAPIRGNDDALTLFSVLDHCESAMGSRELRRWLNQPLRDKRTAAERHEAVAAFVSDPEFSDAVLQELRELPDVERTTSRIALGTVRPRELAALRDALPATAAIRSMLGMRPESAFRAIADSLALEAEIGGFLTAALLDEPAALPRDGDVIRSEYSAELKELRHFRDETGQVLLEMERRERAATGIPTLRIQFNKIQGYYIEISKSALDAVPLRYQRKQTLKSAERFVTPELKAFEDKAFSAKERAAALEKKLYEELIASLAPHVGKLLEASRALARLDVLHSLAEHARSRQWVKPELTERAGIRIKAGRHPVVETTLEVYVPNSCRLVDGRRMLIITGPNMGGKSTYMRSIALIVLLAWAGSFVPAEAAEIGPIDRIHTRIGASDDLARGRSTFMVEMTEAAAILNQATDHSLVLMDEIGRGTSTYDGLSLAAAIAQDLVQSTRAFTLFATHYFELTALSATLREVANVHVSATQAKHGIVFLHEIAEGPASRSYGIAVAQLAGIPAPVVRRAKAFMTELEERDQARSQIQPELFENGGFFKTAADNDAKIDVSDAMPEDDARLERLDSAIALQDKLADIDADSLSAREALNLLYALQKEAQKGRAAAENAGRISAQNQCEGPSRLASRI